MSGVNASTLWYVDVDDPTAVLRDAASDREAAQALVVQLHPGLEVTRVGDEPLSEATELDEGEVVVGCFSGVSIVRTGESLPPVPSSLVNQWISPTGFRHTYLYSSSSVTGAGSWGVFAHWDGAELKRSFSATPINIVEDLGLPQVWERPFWAGEHPMQPSVDVLPDPQTLPFDPAEFAEAASRAWLGEDLDPASISVSRFAIYPAGDIPTSVRRLAEREQERSKRRSLLTRLFRK
ncbi:DUF6928 family protein [Rhodococcus xishaensis]|uniref:Uncharacterized protein n=1 Tax=Rhodococcus xishaensis TaxID=2487364 RepID=A0A3S3A6M3_9NOCA|nr:hypothetical protein EGT50_15790 [Rhodococcus xishaensis]